MSKKNKKKKTKINDVIKSFQKVERGSGTSPFDLGEMARSILPQDFGKKDEYINPDKLVRSKSYDVFDDMLRDDAISPLVKLKKMLTLAFEYRIVPYDSDEQSRKKAEFVSWVLSEFMDRSIFKAFWHVIDHEYYGFSLTEIIWNIIENGEYKNSIGISNLKSKPQKSFIFNPDEYGNLTGSRALKQVIKGNMNQEKFLDINKFLHHVYNQRNENPYGNSHLSDVYRAWWCKDVVYHFYTKHLEKWGSPVIETLIPPNLKKKDKIRIAKILDSFQNGTSFYHRNDVEFKVWKVMPPSQYVNAIQLFNTAISRGLGVPDLLGFTTTGSGSFALGKEQAALFYGLVGVDRDSLVDLINYDLIPRLEDYNYDPNGKYSFMEVSRVKIKDFTTVLDIFKGSYEAAGYNPAHLPDLNRFRSQLGLDELLPGAEFEDYLDSWNEVRRIGRGQDIEEDIIVEDENVPPPPKDEMPNDTDKEISAARHIEKLRKQYAGNYAVDVGKDFDELAGQFENSIAGGLNGLADAALREVMASWNDDDVEIYSKVLELDKKTDLSKKINIAHKEAHKRGMNSALKELKDIMDESGEENNE